MPRVFGFKVHVAAALARWQDGERVEQQRGLREAGVENAAFLEDEGEVADEEDGLGRGREEGGEDVERVGAEGDGAMEVVKE